MQDKLVTKAPALEKGLAVLELMASSSEPLSLTQIARLVGRKVPEIQRIVQALVDLAYIWRNTQNGYVLSNKLFRIAQHYPPFAYLSELAVPAMNEYTLATKESVHLSVECREQMLILRQAEGHALTRVALEVGSLNDMMRTVSGRILLVDKSPEEIERLAQREKVSAEVLAKALRAIRKIRAEGYHHSNCEVYRGVFDLGVPVRNLEGLTIAVITTSYIKRRALPQSAKTLLPFLQAAAKSIETKIRQLDLPPRARHPRR